MMGFESVAAANPADFNEYASNLTKLFAFNLAASGRQFMDMYQFPVDAMVACGCIESNWGFSTLYRMTNCPFNLQKPANWEWPHCDVLKSKTFRDLQQTQWYWTTFCKAVDLADSVRLFCEWIVHYPNTRASGQLMAVKGDAKSFARSLPLVGFGSGPNPGKDYADMVDIVAPIIRGPAPARFLY